MNKRRQYPRWQDAESLLVYQKYIREVVSREILLDELFKTIKQIKMMVLKR